MHLKRMELFGFKSFAEKSELSLGEGISAIVGPNGCGKSNIVDAVRWALGEQSVKSLRGSRMDEIIFSGSDSRKPLNFAEVSLTFTGASTYLNLEYDEVTITRRLFRNGDSEYYINKTPCRLKDITEMFMDTGLGKEVYSVIGQGRVDEIINSRPEERREIFEEAAGILKYKLRKKEARRRLDETRDNLIRVQDLVYELGTQIEPLQEQAEVTREYRRLQHQIEGEEKKLLSFKLKQTRDELEKVNRQLQSVNDALLSSASKRGQREKALQDLKNSLADSINAKKKEEQKLNQLVRYYEQQENELKLLRERESHYREQLEQNHKRINQLDQIMADFADRKVRAEDDLLAKNKEYESLEEKLHILRENLQTLEQSETAGKIEDLQEDIYKAEARREAASVNVSELNRRLVKLREQLDNTLAEEKQLRIKLENYTAKLDTLKSKITNQQESLHAGEDSVKRMETAREQISNKLVEVVADEQKLREKLNGISGRLNLLKEQDAALTGYYRGVKEVMQAGPRIPGIIGPVADLIKVDNEYVQAVESALGSSMQYLVADTEKSVQGAIRYLKEQNRGWATFLPLNILHQSASPLERYPGWRELKGVIGKASELVKVEPAYRKAVDYLLASVLICRNLEDATSAARFVSYSCKVVTLDGEMINPGGVMRGGSLPKRNAGMPLGRRREIEELQKEHASIEEQYKKTSGIVSGTRDELEKLANELNSKSKINNKMMEELSELKREMELSELEKETIEAKAAAEKQAHADLSSEETEVRVQLNKQQAEIENSKKTSIELEQKLAELKFSHRQFIEEKNKLEQSITDTLVQISSCGQQLEGLKTRIAELDESLVNPAEEKAENESAINKYKKDLADNKTIQQEVSNKLEELDNERAELIVHLEKIVDEADQNEAALIEMEEDERRQQNQLARREKRERQLSVEQTRLQTEVNYQEIRFKELFKKLEILELEDDYNPDRGKLEIENLKEDLDALGEVNLGAIEELSRLEDRISFLEEQKDDLLKGEASLNKVLAEIDQRMEYYFKIAFDQINENFNTTFQSLFQGGKVSLKLTDESNILESGIEIIAQPPGKKLQNITLFSGGEKVLIAIALVFAILRFKPAPFYLLDEVESMLDDANLTRFTGFLKDNSKDAQFILITHRKRTMEEAEVLYGVTMPEPGVSRLVSIKLEDKLVAGEK